MADVIATKSLTQLQAKDVSKTTNKVDLLIRHYRIKVPPEIGAPSYLMSDIPPIPPLPMPSDSRSSDTESIATVQELLKSLLLTIVQSLYGMRLILALEYFLNNIS